MKENTFYIISLGCAKNLVDSNVLAQLLEAEGLGYARSARQAEFIIVNTCGFIHDSRQESHETISELFEKRKPGQKIIAAGCLAERWREKLLLQHPALSGMVGTKNLSDIIPLIRHLRNTEAKAEHGWIHPHYAVLNYPPEASFTAIQGGSSYLKIADGCHRSCSFCAIPGIKGTLVSRSVEDVVLDALFLQSEGVKEINLIAQDVTAYGIDRGEKDGLAKLMGVLLPKIPDIPWIRLLYTYPGMITDALIDLMSANNRLLPYLDIPLQHADPQVLQAMRRPSDMDNVTQTIQKMREQIPNLVVRSTFIVGFPNETEQSFQNLVDFVRKTQFDHLGVFTYSPEENTAAYKMPDIIPQKTKEERKAALMEIQSKISLQKNQELIGKRMDVLVEGVDREQGIVIGRSYRDAPEIDGLVVASGSAQVGDFCQITIENAGPYDLFGSQTA